jgi:hypothetical protein
MQLVNITFSKFGLELLSSSGQRIHATMHMSIASSMLIGDNVKCELSMSSGPNIFLGKLGQPNL